MVLLQPELQIGKQEVQNTGLAVIKALGSPGRMLTLFPVVEELPGGSVKHIDSFCGILNGVGMDQIQQNPDAQLVGTVHQVFQIFWVTKPGAGGTEVGYLRAKAAVVGMFHNGHKLHCIVACLFDPGQNLGSKFPVSTDPAFFLSHTHMGFVDVKLIFAYEVLVGPGKGALIINDFCIEGVVALILNHPFYIQWEMLRAGSFIIHHGLDLAAMPQRIVSGQVDFPVFVVHSGQGVGGLVPVVELTLQIQLLSGRRPFPVIPAAIYMVKTVILVAVGKVGQGLILRQKSRLSGIVYGHSQIDIACKFLQLRIAFQ